LIIEANFFCHSTVSKVLRQKEKYLFPDDGSRSPVKRSKGKFPDIERALAVWAKNTRKQGVALTDMMIREKAKFFATSVGISDSQFKANGQGWLEKFKQKNNLHSNGRGRSESDVTGVTRMVSGGLMSPKPGHSRTDSTPVLGSPMMQESKSQDSHGTESPESFMEFGGFNKQQVSGLFCLASIACIQLTWQFLITQAQLLQLPHSSRQTSEPTLCKHGCRTCSNAQDHRHSRLYLLIRPTYPHHHRRSR